MPGRLNHNMGPGMGVGGAMADQMGMQANGLGMGNPYGGGPGPGNMQARPNFNARPPFNQQQANGSYNPQFNAVPSAPKSTLPLNPNLPAAPFVLGGASANRPGPQGRGLPAAPFGLQPSAPSRYNNNNTAQMGFGNQYPAGPGMNGGGHAANRALPSGTPSGPAGLKRPAVDSWRSDKRPRPDTRPRHDVALEEGEVLNYGDE